jgi:hypothetical protein
MKIALTKQALKSAAMTVAPVGAGILAARIGGTLARRIGPVATFAAGGEMQSAVVDGLAGAAVVLVAAPLGAKALKAAPEKVAAGMGAGVLLAVLAPTLGARIFDAIDNALDSLPGMGASVPGGSVFYMPEAMPGGILADGGPSSAYANSRQITLTAPGGMAGEGEAASMFNLDPRSLRGLIPLD